MESISVSYGMVRAIENVDLEIYSGEIVALIGANGAGKSTLLETILGLHKSAIGRIVFLEEEITRKATEWIVAKGIALCPEGRGILHDMNVLDNLLLGAFNNRGRIAANLDLVFGLFPILKQRSSQMAGTLSGGQQQMLSIGRALMAQPRLLMLDEPSLGLAPMVVNDILEIVSKLARNGQTVLLSEQNAKKALQFSDRAYVFETGRVVLSGASNDLMNNESVINAYLGGELKTDQRGHQ